MRSIATSQRYAVASTRSSSPSGATVTQCRRQCGSASTTRGADGGSGSSVKRDDDRPVLMPSEVSERVGFFDQFAGYAAHVASRAVFFAFCVALIVIWAPTIVLLRDVDTWQLIINTATTII